MNAFRFDVIARMVTAAASRRGLVGFGIGAAFLEQSNLVTDAKKKRKKCKKKCGPCRRCKKGKCKPKTDGTACETCGECQGGVCVSLCQAGEQCLPNGTCATSCDDEADCPDASLICTCNIDEGFESVCRIVPNQSPDTGCDDFTPCESTADCEEGTVCSSTCIPFKCVPIC
jgi:hypothetical protein